MAATSREPPFCIGYGCLGGRIGFNIWRHGSGPSVPGGLRGGPGLLVCGWGWGRCPPTGCGVSKEAKSGQVLLLFGLAKLARVWGNPGPKPGKRLVVDPGPLRARFGCSATSGIDLGSLRVCFCVDRGSLWVRFGVDQNFTLGGLEVDFG